MSAIEFSIYCIYIRYIKLCETYPQETFGEEQIQYNMEKIGYRVGFSLVEKATKEEARFKENVEIVKYICKVNYGLV